VGLFRSIFVESLSLMILQLKNETPIIFISCLLLMGTITTSLYVCGQTNSTERDVSNDSNSTSTSGSNGSSSISNFARDKAIIESTETKMIPVADIYVAYKTFGNGSPVLLITGFRSTMDTWDPVILNALAVNHTVIAFDNRGMGKTTAGIKEFSQMIQLV